jgi:hypothetical protein
MRRAALLLGLLTLPTAAMADPSWHLNVQTYSFHEHTTDVDLHNTTPGLGLIRRQDNWLAGAGVFRNSVGRWAGYGYGGYQFPLARMPAGPLRLGAIAGLTHNYNFNDGGIVPLGAAVMTIPVTRTFSIDLVGIPRIKGATYNTLNISLSWQFR